MKKLFKPLAVIIFSGYFMLGCSSSTSEMTFDEFREYGRGMAMEYYEPSEIYDIETIRGPIHSSFVAAQGIFDAYMDNVKNNIPYNNYLNATKGKSDEEIIALRAQLAANGQLHEVIAFEETNQEIFEEAALLILSFVVQAANYHSVSFSNIISQAQASPWIIPGEWSKLGVTKDEIDFVNASIGHIDQLNSIATAAENME